MKPGHKKQDRANKLRITAISTADLAGALSSAYGRQITEQQVRQVAERGDLLRADGTVSIIEYAAFLIKEMANGRTAEST